MNDLSTRLNKMGIRGLTSQTPPHVVLSPEQEAAFRSWYSPLAKQYGIDPNPDNPEHYYDYRASWLAGKGPNETGHWSSEFKDADSPERFKTVEGSLTDTITGTKLLFPARPDATIVAPDGNFQTPEEKTLHWVTAPLTPEAESRPLARTVKAFAASPFRMIRAGVEAVRAFGESYLPPASPEAALVEKTADAVKSFVPDAPSILDYAAFGMGRPVAELGPALGGVYTKKVLRTLKAFTPEVENFLSEGIDSGAQKLAREELEAAVRLSSGKIIRAPGGGAHSTAYLEALRQGAEESAIESGWTLKGGEEFVGHQEAMALGHQTPKSIVSLLESREAEPLPTPGEITRSLARDDIELGTPLSQVAGPSSTFGREALKVAAAKMSTLGSPELKELVIQLDRVDDPLARILSKKAADLDAVLAAAPQNRRLALSTKLDDLLRATRKAFPEVKVDRKKLTTAIKDVYRQGENNTRRLTDEILSEWILP